MYFFLTLYASGTLLGRWSNGGGVKYKIIDIDGIEISLSDLLKRYFFSGDHYTLAPSLKINTITII